MKKEFEYIHDVNGTFKLRIRGEWQIVEGELEYYIDSSDYSFGGVIWRDLPYSVVEWLDDKMKVDQLAYRYIMQSCVNSDQPDTTTDLQQEQHITDLMTQNKLS